MWHAIALVEVGSTLWFVRHEGKVLIVILWWRSAHVEDLRTTLATSRLPHKRHLWASRENVPVTNVTREELRCSLPGPRRGSPWSRGTLLSSRGPRTSSLVLLGPLLRNLWRRSALPLLL